MKDDTAQAMLSAVAAGDSAAVRALLAESPDLVRQQVDMDKTFLHQAAELDRPEVARILIDAGASYDLWAAAGLGELAFVNTCFDAEGSWLRAPSLVPSRERHGECTLSTDRGYVLDAAFHVACRNGHTAVARCLHRCGADPDALGPARASALHWSAARGFLECVEFLLEVGANPEARDAESGLTPLGRALETGHAPIARALFHAGAAATHDQLARLQELEAIST